MLVKNVFGLFIIPYYFVDNSLYNILFVRENPWKN